LIIPGSSAGAADTPSIYDAIDRFCQHLSAEQQTAALPLHEKKQVIMMLDKVIREHSRAREMAAKQQIDKIMEITKVEIGQAEDKLERAQQRAESDRFMENMLSTQRQNSMASHASRRWTNSFLIVC